MRNEEDGSWYKKRKAHSQCKRVMRILIHKDGCLIFEGGVGGVEGEGFLFSGVYGSIQGAGLVV